MICNRAYSCIYYCLTTFRIQYTKYTILKLLNANQTQSFAIIASESEGKKKKNRAFGFLSWLWRRRERELAAGHRVIRAKNKIIVGC
ncbi:hypothetical protein NC652_038952 [Populus alba x Populus x berolinensis]|nr:hypothetical protein NC652_038952 [Populus alba x Populus x berolinensis]